MDIRKLGHATPKPRVKSILGFGFLIIAIFFGGGFSWAYFAPLQSAAIAQGKVIVVSYHKEIQHLDGGIVENLLVKDGEAVKQGQLLIVLDKTQIQAELNLLQSDLYVFLAQEARLIAERDGLSEIPFPEVIFEQKDNVRLQKIISSQKNIFKTNRLTLEKLNESYENQITVLNKSIESGKGQIEADNNRIFYLNKELYAIETLLKDGRIEQNRLWEVQDRLSRAKSEMFEHEREINEANNRILDIRLRMLNEKNERELTVVNELRDIQQKIAQTEEKISSVKDKLRRAEVKAPISGNIVNMRSNTIGGVIRAGETFLDIVPINEQLIIEVRIRTDDIDLVRPGLQTNIKLSAYDTRFMPDLVGTLIYVSPDSFQDKENPAEPYYIGRIEVTREELMKVAGVELYPGMTAQAMIVTDKRTFWNYFITPIRKSLDRAFREN